jgi:hypothetical protein
MLLEAAGAAFMINAREDFLKRDSLEAGGRFVSVVLDTTRSHPRKSTSAGAHP